MKPRVATFAGIRSAAVRKATGHPWSDWFTLLDKAGARSWPQAEISRWLQQNHPIGDWWSQRVTVGYEEACGRRLRHPPAEGFTVSVTRTIAAPVAKVFAAWRDSALRERWLPRTPLTVRKATPHKSIRIIWGDGTLLSVNFWPKGPLKCQVVPEHTRLPDAATAEKRKAFWTERLEALRLLLEPPA